MSYTARAFDTLSEGDLQKLEFLITFSERLLENNSPGDVANFLGQFVEPLGQEQRLGGWSFGIPTIWKQQFKYGLQAHATALT